MPYITVYEAYEIVIKALEDCSISPGDKVRLLKACNKCKYKKGNRQYIVKIPYNGKKE